jgi:hypothetical protein
LEKSLSTPGKILFGEKFKPFGEVFIWRKVQALRGKFYFEKSLSTQGKFLFGEKWNFTPNKK